MIIYDCADDVIVKAIYYERYDKISQYTMAQRRDVWTGLLKKQFWSSV